MSRDRAFWLAALLALPAACLRDGTTDRAAEGNNGATAELNGAAASSAAAQSENAAVTAATADCPYATRGFRAGVYPEPEPKRGRQLEIDWDSMPDAQRRYPELNTVERTPLVVVELLPGTRSTPPELSTGWMEYRSTVPYNAANTHAVLRCGGRELARAAIPRVATPPAPVSTSPEQAGRAASGACPFQTRNWRVTLDKSIGPEGGLEMTIRGEVNADAQGRYPMIGHFGQRPPELLLDVDTDPMATPAAPPGWVGIGNGVSYDPAYTHAVVRCAGREIARIPIPRG